MALLILAGLVAGLVAIRYLRRVVRALERAAAALEEANRTPAWRALATTAVEFCDRPAPQSVQRRDALRELKARLALEEARRP
jgi:hypothetical protein